MANPKCSDEEFISLFTKHGAPETGRILKCTERAVYKRRSYLSRFSQITTPSKLPTKVYPHRDQLEVKNGCVIVGSDFHIWPGVKTRSSKLWLTTACDAHFFAMFIAFLKLNRRSRVQ
jgi:hypothetical protein